MIHNKLKKITGIISFTGAFICLGIIVREIIRDSIKPYQYTTQDLVTIFSFICLGISTMVYVFLTKDVIIEMKESDKIKSENQILKLQIEQKELKKKLTIE